MSPKSKAAKGKAKRKADDLGSDGPTTKAPRGEEEKACWSDDAKTPTVDWKESIACGTCRAAHEKQIGNGYRGDAWKRCFTSCATVLSSVPHPQY